MRSPATSTPGGPENGRSPMLPARQSHDDCNSCRRKADHQGQHDNLDEWPRAEGLPEIRQLAADD